MDLLGAWFFYGYIVIASTAIEASSHGPFQSLWDCRQAERAFLARPRHTTPGCFQEGRD